jgi:hypothetical protein
MTMPAVSRAQQKLMGLAEHNPSKVSKKNRGVLKMSHQQLHDFASSSPKEDKAFVKRMKGKQ